jgi:hypothetical protein
MPAVKRTVHAAFHESHYATLVKTEYPAKWISHGTAIRAAIFSAIKTTKLATHDVAFTATDK